MRVVYMGTPDFSVPALKSLIKEHEVIAVVTQPDKPKGRGEQMQYPPVKEAAIEAGIKVYQPVKVKNLEFVNILYDLNPDVIVVAAFGQILSKEILEIPKYGCINIHASLLPKYRGAAPIQNAIINGDKKTGVTTMYMAEGLDTGDMLDVMTVKIADDETGGSLHDKLAEVGASLILTTLKSLEDGSAVRKPQDDSKASYVGMLKKSMGKIDFNDDAAKIERLIRGLNPWPSAFTSLDGKNLKIWKAKVSDLEYEGLVGGVVDIENNEIYIKCGKGTLIVTELQLEGKKRMDSASFLRGYKLNAESVFGGNVEK